MLPNPANLVTSTEEILNEKLFSVQHVLKILERNSSLTKI